MGLIFVLLTQLMNLTPFTLDFEVINHGRGLLPELPPGKTRSAKPSRVHRRIKRYEPTGWKFRLLLDGEFTGVELDPLVILDHVRLVFRIEGDGDGDGDVLCVDGVREIRGMFSIDVLYRHRFFGFKRNSNWNRRTPVLIQRSDSKLATKLRNAEGDCQPLAPFVDSEKRYASSPKERPKRDTRDRNYKEDEIKDPPAKMRSKDASIDDGKYNIKSRQPTSATVAGQQVGPRDVTRPWDPSVKPGWQYDDKSYIYIPWPLDPPAKQAKERKPRSKDASMHDQPKSANVADQHVESGGVARVFDPPTKPRRGIRIDDDENATNITRPLESQAPAKELGLRKSRSKDARIDDSKSNIKSMPPKSEVADQEVGPRRVTSASDPPIKPRRRVRFDDDETDINIPRPLEPPAKQAGPRVVTSASDTPIKPIRRVRFDDEENDINIPRPLEPPKQAEPRELRSKDACIDDTKNNSKSMPPESANVVSQQVGPRDVTHPSNPSVEPRRQKIIDFDENYINVPRPRELPIDALRCLPPPNGAATTQQARPGHNESPTNVVQKDSFVHGILFVFALVVATWIMI